MRQAACKILCEKLGHNIVKTDYESCFNASLDDMRISILPEALITPLCDEDIATALSLANTYDVPITIRGAGTGKVGGCVPACGGWVIDLSQLKTCIIDPVSRTAQVGPGLITNELNCMAAAYGLFFPPDPASAKFCSIGGNIATNAGGLRAAKYGVTRDYVLALEGFLPTGEKVHWGANVRKYASGFNLRDLWIGSAGLLGIITQATLRLAPLPEKRKTFLCSFPNNESALKATQELLRSQIQTSVLEFLDSTSLICAEKRRGKSFFKTPCPTRAILLIEVDGNAEDVSKESEKIRTWAKNYAETLQEAHDELEAESLWEARRTCSQAMFLIANSKLNEDICIPVKNYTELLKYTQKITEETGLATPTFGHAADGNFHTHIMYNGNIPEERNMAKAAVQKLMEYVIKLEGVITGEHGVGLAKSPFFTLQHSPAEIAAMRAIKTALDPKDILGRGKMFTPFNIWEQKTVSVKLPWDKK